MYKVEKEISILSKVCMEKANAQPTLKGNNVRLAT